MTGARCQTVTSTARDREKELDDQAGVDQTADRELGPIDYIVVEWTGKQPTGEALPHLIDLIDRGIVRLIDILNHPRQRLEDTLWVFWSVDGIKVPLQSYHTHQNSLCR